MWHVILLKHSSVGEYISYSKRFFSRYEGCLGGCDKDLFDSLGIKSPSSTSLFTLFIQNM